MHADCFYAIHEQCYEELLEKFPGSASLSLDYANFCDVVRQKWKPEFDTANRTRGLDIVYVEKRRKRMNGQRTKSYSDGEIHGGEQKAQERILNMK